MEGSKISRLPKPSTVKAAQMKLKPLTGNRLNRIETDTAARATRLVSLRRSKSIADLRTVIDKPRSLPKINQIQNSKPSTIKSTVKRKVEKSSDEVKPKIAKQTKIPDWDYKARFTQLREKFATLNENHKKQCLKLTELEDVEKKYQEIQKQNQLLEKENISLSATKSHLTNENTRYKMNFTEIETNFICLTKLHEELKQTYEDLLLEANTNAEKVEKLNEENIILKNTLQNLTDDHNRLKHEHDNLLTSHDSLKTHCNKINTDKGNLAQNLQLEEKRTKELMEEVDFLKKDINKGEVLRRKLHNTVQDLKGNIRVFCRVRPPINLEEEERLQCMITFIDEKSMEIRKSRESISTISGKPTDLKVEFTLDRVFEPNTSQTEIFEDLSQLVQSALDGYDICVFAYGQTGSGKTYTMQGENDPENAGMIPRTIDLVFNSIDNLKRTGWIYNVKASFLEIYNENVRDLLNPSPTQNLEIRYNEGKGTTVMNLTIQPINSACELKKLMEEAHRNRAVAATDFNEHSSRSHAVTKIYLEGVNDDSNVIYIGSINLVDLAGSESAKTSANERLVETKNINKSLSTLGNVMLALYNKEKHIPYRNSKLTYLLQSSLGGNSKTLMVVNISPFEECYSESINSLRFAAKVKEVKISAKRNKTQFVPLVGKA